MAVAYFSRFGMSDAVRGVDAATALLLPVVWVATAAATGAYDTRFVGVGSTEYGRLVRVFARVTVLVAFVSYALQLDLARGFIVLTLPLALAFDCAGRYVARLRLHRMRRTGRSMNRVLAVGSAASVQKLATAMRRDPCAGLHVVGACLPESEVRDPAARNRLADAGIPFLGSVADARDAVDRIGARSVGVVSGDVPTDDLRALAWKLEGSGADLIVSTGLSEVAGQRVHVQSVAGLPLLRVDEPRFSGFRRQLKGAFDRAAAAVALIVLSPLLLALAALVRFTSRGPALYFQERIGRNGKPFRMVKFRSMQVGADALVSQLAGQNEVADGVLFKIREDPRVTPVGRVLRRFSLDELPQLLNVLGGSMSLVGPRPPLPSEVERYEDDVRRRLLVKPGLTGLWQVSGRSDLSWEESVRLDLHYVENWTLGLDMVLLCKTARAVVRPTGAY